MLNAVLPEFKEEHVQFVRRDTSSKSSPQPVIVGLRDPHAYLIQQKILSAAKDRGLDNRIISPPEKTTRQNQRRNPSQLEFEWTNGDTPWIQESMHE